MAPKDRYERLLTVRARDRVLAIPAPWVREVMRPTRIEAVAEAPSFVRGATMVRGAVVPVIDLAMLFEGVALEPIARLVSIVCAGRPLALAAGAVLGLERAEALALEPISPWLALGAGPAVELVGRLAGEMLAVVSFDAAWVDQAHDAIGTRP